MVWPQRAKITIFPGDPMWLPCVLPQSADLRPPAIFPLMLGLLTAQKRFLLAVGMADKAKWQ